MVEMDNDRLKGGKDDNNIVSDVTRTLIFGGAGGVAASLITYTNDTVRRFLQLQGSRGTTEHFRWILVSKESEKKLMYLL
jgi:hypothetical protein